MLIGHPSSKRLFSPSLNQVGVAVGLLSISAFFMALIVAYALIMHGKAGQRHVAMPVSLWVSTGLLLASSFVLEAARHALRRAELHTYRVLVFVTTVLGIGFLASQLYSWRVLWDEGVYLQSNPHGSVFYVFTGAHGLHLFSGILCLFYLLHRGRLLTELSEADLPRHRISAGAIALYWHFMDGLWIVLFTLLLIWN